MVRARKSSTHGGTRTASPGKAYTNRTDLKQPVTAPTGQAYGERKAQVDAQRAIPLPQAPPVVPLGAPTQRPQEPLTAGLPVGPGPGPEALAPMAPPPQEAPILEMFQALYAQYPSNDLRTMIEELQYRGTT